MVGVGVGVVVVVEVVVEVVVVVVVGVGVGVVVVVGAEVVVGIGVVMKYPIPDWLKEGRSQPADATLTRTLGERELDKLLKAQRALGYIECVNDLRKGLAKCRNNFTLIGLEPYLRNVLLKAEYYGDMK